MKLYKFSEESVEYAKALDVLDFDIVHVIKPCTLPGVGGLIAKRQVFGESNGRKCELPELSFPEIEDNEMVAVSYIIHHDIINETLEKSPFNGWYE